MKIPFVDSFLDLLGEDLPSMTRMDEYIDYILPLVATYSEDLSESAFFTEMDWVEVLEEEHYLETVHHLFMDSSSNQPTNEETDDQQKDYQRSVEGNVSKGQWSFFNESYPAVSIKTESGISIFEIAFVNQDFFILKKEGSSYPKSSVYFFMGKARLLEDLEWLEAMELLYNIYRYRSKFMIFVAGIVFFVVLILFFSVI